MKLVIILFMLTGSLMANADAGSIVYSCESSPNVDASISVQVEKDEHGIERLIIDGEDKGQINLVKNVDEVLYQNDAFKLLVEGNQSKLILSEEWAESLTCI